MTALSHYVVGISIFFSLRGAGLQVKTETISQAFFWGKMKTDTEADKQILQNQIDFMKKTAFKAGSLLVNMRYSCHKSHNFEWKKTESLWSNNFHQREVSDYPRNQIVRRSSRSRRKKLRFRGDCDTFRASSASCGSPLKTCSFCTTTFSRIEGELPALESQLSELRQKKAICCPWLQMTHVQ